MRHYIVALFCVLVLELLYLDFGLAVGHDAKSIKLSLNRPYSGESHNSLKRTDSVTLMERVTPTMSLPKLLSNRLIALEKGKPQYTGSFPTREGLFDLKLKNFKHVRSSLAPEDSKPAVQVKKQQETEEKPSEPLITTSELLRERYREHQAHFNPLEVVDRKYRLLSEIKKYEYRQRQRNSLSYTLTPTESEF